jgi:hypothetical protein
MATQCLIEGVDAQTALDEVAEKYKAEVVPSYDL